MSVPTAAIVLVGGKGTRLRPLTETTPKPLLPVVGQPVLERVLARLAAAGVQDAVLALGYGADAFVQAYPEGELASVRLHYAVEHEPLDTAGAVAFAARSAGFNGQSSAPWSKPAPSAPTPGWRTAPFSSGLRSARA